MADKKSAPKPTGVDEPKAPVPSTEQQIVADERDLDFDERGREMDKNLGRENRHGDVEPAA